MLADDRERLAYGCLRFHNRWTANTVFLLCQPGEHGKRLSAATRVFHANPSSPANPTVGRSLTTESEGTQHSHTRHDHRRCVQVTATAAHTG